MDVQLIECDRIDTPKPDGQWRTFNEEFANNLAKSIEADRLYHPICVRPNPDAQDRFLLVHGRHRLYAQKDILKRDRIAANVIVDMDDTDVEMARITENLWCNPLTKAQHSKSLKWWWERYAARNPDKVGRGVAGGAAMKRKAQRKKRKAQRKKAAAKEPLDYSLASQEDVLATLTSAFIGEEQPEGEDDLSFAELVAATSGRSLSSAKRDIRIARAFTEEQHDVFDRRKISRADQLAVAKIENVTRRGAAVDLIDGGMKPAEAIREVMKDAAAIGDDEVEVKAEAEPIFTDDEWFEASCGAAAKLLADPAWFRADALLYRDIDQSRRVFQAEIRERVEAPKAAYVKGSLHDLIHRVIALTHPADWPLCDECQGQGLEDGCVCDTCRGGGYLITTEQSP